MIGRIRILIVDDWPRSRQSLCALLAAYSEAAEIHEANNGLEALQRIQEFSPDIVFMDVRLPGLDGIKAMQIIKRHASAVRIIALSMDCDYRSEALAAGADAFVCKSESPDKLLETLAGIIAGLPKDNSVR